MKSDLPFAFNSLPAELRVKIWEESIENSQGLPEAQFFRIGGGRRERRRDGTSQSALNNSEGSKDMCSVHPPSWDPSGNMCLSWVAPENPSGYVINAGLWNASTESREVLLKHLKKTNPEFHQNQLESFKLMGVSSFSSLVLNPNRDLHCFQVRDVNDHTTMAISSRNMVPQHIAFEYKSEWGEPTLFENIQFYGLLGEEYINEYYSHRNELEEIFWAINKDKGSMGPGQHIWFIDYNIKPMQKLEPEDVKGCQIFYARDRKFVEVKPSPCWISRYRRASEEAREGFIDSFTDTFLRREFGSRDQLPTPTVGVLACLVDSDFV